MVKSFQKFEKNSNNTLLYYAFDWDDNILNMSTVIHMEKLENGKWIPIDVSTSTYSKIRNDDNYRILENDPSKAFSEFRDFGERGDNAFKSDVIESINNKSFGPAWTDFVECLTNGSLFSIITARGHESNAIRKGISWIINNALSEDELYKMYNNLKKFSYLFAKEINYSRNLKGRPTDNVLFKEYLDSCDFIGVSSPSREGSASNPEEAKAQALLEFKHKVDKFANNLGTKAKIGFSDDDSSNVKTIESLFRDINHEKFPNIIEYVVKNTSNPSDITKKVINIEETSHQAPGLESSIMPFTSFNNMTGRLYPTDSKTRQDDYTNQFRRQAEFLTKNAKEILKNRKEERKRKNKNS